MPFNTLKAKKKLSASYDASTNINQGYFMPRAFSSTYFPYRYQYILDNYNTITRDTRLFNLNWTHTLSNRSFYEFTIGKLIKKYTDKLNYISTKDGRKELVISLREEIQKGVKKERYLSKEDAQLLNQFIKKIQKELQESEN